MPALIISLIFLLIPFPARAETIELMDGQVIEGELVSETQDMMTVRQDAGDGFLERVFEKKEIRKIGDRSIENELKAGSGAQASKADSGPGTKSPGIDFEARERVEYERGVRDIIDDIKRLSGIWRRNRYDYDDFRQWFSLAGPGIGRFKEKYSSQNIVSYGMMKMVFLELEHLESDLQDMEKASKAYEDSIARNLSDNWKAPLKKYLDHDESLANEAITKIADYSEMAKAQVLKRE